VDVRGRIGRGVIAVALVAAAAVVAAGGGAVQPVHAAPSCASADGVVTCTFGYTNGADVWAVPDELLAATVTLSGAGGGNFDTGGAVIAGGAGGRARALIVASTADDTWEIRVGGAGGGIGPCVEQTTTPQGGFNGGGNGLQWDSGGFDCESAGGGGATDLRIGGSDLEHRVLVAGGGGGTTNAGCCPEGGDGGGAAGAPGLLSNGDVSIGSVAGEGGNATGTTGSHAGGVGSPGLIGPTGGGGGGGGGGWWGGAGGLGAAGGGGGSGHGPAGATLDTGLGAAPGAHGTATIAYPEPATASIAPAVTSAGVQVTAQPGSHQVMVHVVWGTAPDSLTSSIAPVSMGPGAESASFELTGLAPEQTYYARVITTAADQSASRSAVVPFTTFAPTVAADMQVATNEDQPLTAALEATGPDLAFSTVVEPAHGTVGYSGGSFTYTPDPDYVGGDSFTYRASSGASGMSDDGVVTVDVLPVDDPATANPDAYTTGFGQAVAGNVLDNDIGRDGPLTASLLEPPTGGTVVLDADGSFVYTPNAGFSGTDGFSYRVTDDGGLGVSGLAVGGDVGTVTITVAPPPTTTTVPGSSAPPTPPSAPATSVATPLLPATGAAPRGLVAAAAAALLAGGALVLAGLARRRRA
jgi:hypothetical protein